MRLPLAAILLLALSAGGGGRAARAATIEVASPDGLQAALLGAAPGDTLHLTPGIHHGRVVIETPRLTLEGDPGAIVDGGGAGRTIWVKAPDVTIRRIEVRGSGLSLFDMDAGIFLDKTASRSVVEDNLVEGNLIGIYIWGPHDALVRRNRVVGRSDLRMSERGSGVQLWNTPGSQVTGNDISAGRDGIFTVSSSGNLFHGNTFRDVRFAVHYMYTNNSEISDNLSIGNSAGYVIMFSDHLKIHGNVSDHDRDHGLLFNYANGSEMAGNVVRDSKKCVFIYNANKNTFHDNWFEGCQVGIHFTAGSERNDISENAFVGNQTQVMYVGTRSLDWATRGRGNYWSDNPAFDLNGDGIADTAYRPNNLMDEVIWRAPAAKLLMNSPATRLVRWAQAEFPGLHPGGVIDSAPLMLPSHPAALSRLTSAP